MGDVIQVQAQKSKDAKAAHKMDAAAKPTIKEILHADKDVRDFYQLISDFGMREKAIELISSRMNRSKI